MEPDWHAIERLYVFGVVVCTRGDGSEVRSFPTIRQLADKLGIARSVVGRRASRHEWAARRGRFQVEFRAATWQKLAERELGGGGRGNRTS
jgi:hypothetical protein